MMPNMMRPAWPAACSKALAAGLSSASEAPPATTPRMARKRMVRMIPVMMMPVTELRVISLTWPGPVVPESMRRCAPAYVM